MHLHPSNHLLRARELAESEAALMQAVSDVKLEAGHESILSNAQGAQQEEGPGIGNTFACFHS